MVIKTNSRKGKRQCDVYISLYIRHPNSIIPVLMRVSPTFDWYKALMDNTIFPSIASSTILFVRRSKTLYHRIDLLKERSNTIGTSSFIQNIKLI